MYGIHATNKIDFTVIWNAFLGLQFFTTLWHEKRQKLMLCAPPTTIVYEYGWYVEC